MSNAPPAAGRAERKALNAANAALRNRICREFNAAFAWRIRDARRRLSRRLGRRVSQREMAAMLSERAGREVTAAEYAKFENSAKPAVRGHQMPHDLIWHFCEITITAVDALYRPVKPAIREQRV